MESKHFLRAFFFFLEQNKTKSINPSEEGEKINTVGEAQRVVCVRVCVCVEM